MISTELQEILVQITDKTVEREGKLKTAANWRDKEKEYRTYSMSAEKEAEDIEHEIDQLQLSLRKVLNGEPSSVKIEPPAQAEEQIGREE